MRCFFNKDGEKLISYKENEAMKMEISTSASEDLDFNNAVLNSTINFMSSFVL